MKNKVGKTGVVLIISVLCALFFCVNDAAASDDRLLINEIYPAPLEGEKEWAEIFNPSDSDAFLSDYMLKDGAVAAKPLPDIVLKSHRYYLFEISSGWLNNSDEILFLQQKTTGEIIDKVAYGGWENAVLPNNPDISAEDNAVVPPAGRSISRVPDGCDSDDDRADFRLAPKTPGGKNMLPAYSNDVRLNEIYAEPPEGAAAEFIELYNQSAEPIDLSFWSIDDAEGGSAPFMMPEKTVIEAKDYLVFHHNETGITLNDGGDEARLIDPNGDLKSHISYEKAIRGQSFARFAADWQFTVSITPRRENLLTLEVLTPEEAEDAAVTATITQAKELETGTFVETDGTVSVLPGVLSRQYFYIQDEEAGIQIYSYAGEFPELKDGDRISVRGEITSYYGEKRIKIYSPADISILSSSELPPAKKLEISSLGEDDVGLFAEIDGIVSQTSGSTFVVSNQGEITVIVRETANVNKPRLKTGYEVQVRGIVSSHQGKLRILPINTEGVMILTSGSLPVTGKEESKLWKRLATIQSKLRRLSLLFREDFPEEMLCCCKASWAAVRRLPLKLSPSILALPRR